MAPQQILHKIYDKIKSIITVNPNTGQNELLVSNPGRVCTDNSTNDILLADEVFTGEWEDTLNYSNLIVGLKSDQESAAKRGLQLLHVRRSQSPQLAQQSQERRHGSGLLRVQL